MAPLHCCHLILLSEKNFYLFMTKIVSFSKFRTGIEHYEKSNIRSLRDVYDRVNEMREELYIERRSNAYQTT